MFDMESTIPYWKTGAMINQNSLGFKTSLKTTKTS